MTWTTHAQYEGYSADSWQKQRETETVFLASVDSTTYKQHLKTLTARPHVAGSKANEAVQTYMTRIMQQAGFDVTAYPYDVYIPSHPGESSVALVTPFRQPLNQQEDLLSEDPYSADPLLWKGWNAFSGSGDVTAEVVYANYGRKEDFEQLKALGIDPKGKIVIARYGGNFRGFKA
ncbi:MAG: glutamate carboxypeptidase, partial [Flavobacteriia bacterium]|nr:glutamate carboxypeptidase [Flavobacteriia bacterium]